MVPGDFLATLLLVASYLVPLRAKMIRARTLWTCWFIITLHHIVSISIYLNPDLLIGDAAYFHYQAAANNDTDFSPPLSLGSDFYIGILTYVYNMLEPSVFLASQLSILAFSASTVIFINFQTSLGVKRGKNISLLFFGAIPAVVFYGSMPMRESYEVLFFILAAYYGLKYEKNQRPRYFLSFLFSATAMGLFHKGLILYSAALICLTYFTTAKNTISKQTNLVPTIFFAATIILMASYSLYFSSSTRELRGSVVLNAFLEGEITEYIDGTRSQYDDIASRASYDVRFDSSSFSSMLVSIAQIISYYMLAPFFWNVVSIADAYAFLENTLRILLIWFSLTYYFKLPKHDKNKRATFFLLICFFFMELMWSLGTANYGTAMRHHVVSWWIVVLIGMPQLLRRLPRFHAQSRGYY